MKPYLPVLIGLIALGWVPAGAADEQDEAPHRDTVVPAPLKVLRFGDTILNSFIRMHE